MNLVIGPKKEYSFLESRMMIRGRETNPSILTSHDSEELISKYSI